MFPGNDPAVSTPEKTPPTQKNGLAGTVPQHKMILDNNFREPPASVNRLVHDVIGEQAAARPRAPAICSAAVYLTYDELEQLSSRLSAHLVALGIGPRSIVPILSEKVSRF